MILDGDGRCHFAFVQYEKAKTQQELIPSHLKLPRSIYAILQLYVFVQLKLVTAKLPPEDFPPTNSS